MRITRSKAFKFKIQDYEQMDVMASITVDSADLGVSDDERAAMDDAAMDEHVKDLSAFCRALLQDEIQPLLSEARALAERKSSAEDVEKFNAGLGA